MEACGNASWSLDFVHDPFACRRRFRVLNVVDDVTRECLAAIPDTSTSGRRVACDLTALIGRRGRPGMIVPDNGTQLASNAIPKWCAEYTLPTARDEGSTRRAIAQPAAKDINQLAAPVAAGRRFRGRSAGQPAC